VHTAANEDHGAWRSARTPCLRSSSITHLRPLPQPCPRCRSPSASDKS
jgi:hypothetical protein